MQANVRWLNQHKYPEHIPAAVETLRILWNSRTLEEFTENLAAFKRIWQSFCFPYWHYFEHQWCDQVKSTDWAFYSRPPNMPSGDNTIEGWHNRIKHFNNQKSQSLNKILYFLSEQAEYYFRMHSSATMKADWLNQIKTAKRYHTEHTSLKNYGASSSVRIEEVTDSLELPSTVPAEQQVEALTDSPNLMSSTSTDNTTATQPEALLPATTVTSLSQSTTLPPNLAAALKAASAHSMIPPTDAMCHVCHRKSANKECTLRLCQNCCARDDRSCSVSTHRYAKLKGNDHVKDMQNLIQEAIQNNRILWVRYMSGQHSGQVRAIRPKHWVDTLHCKFVLDDMFPEGPEQWNFNKTYIVTKILDAQWNKFQ
jgi:hypothetical protein